MNLRHESRHDPWTAGTALALVAWLCLAPLATVSAQTAPLPGPDFVDPTTGVLPDGRFHALIRQEVPSSGHELRVSGARWTGSAVEIQISTDRDPLVPDLPVVTTRIVPVTVANLPAGSYLVRVGSSQVAVTVPEVRRFRQPMSARWWPSDPADLDRLWLLFERPDECADYRLVQFTAATESGEAYLLVEELPIACPPPGEPPQLAAVAIGHVDPGDYKVALTILRGADQPSPNPSRYDGLIDLHVGDTFSPRIGGTWYDPAQSGHGISLEIIDDGRMLLYWFTFDEQGDPAWLIAEGHPNGRGVRLAAQTVSGGFFPPDLDPDLIVRHEWGTIDLSFDLCDRGSMNWDTGFPGFRSGSMPLQRLTGRAADGCRAEPSMVERLPDWYQGGGSFVRLPSID